MLVDGMVRIARFSSFWSQLWSLFFFSHCVSPLLPSFSSLLCLLSRLCAVVISLFVPVRLFRCSVLSITCFITLSLLRRASGSLVLFRLHRFLLPLRCYAFLPPLRSPPTQIAELLHIVHTCV